MENDLAGHTTLLVSLHCSKHVHLEYVEYLHTVDHSSKTGKYGEHLIPNTYGYCTVYNPLETLYLYVRTLYVYTFILINTSVWGRYVLKYVTLEIVNKFYNLHCKKNFSIFPSPAGVSLTKLSLGGNNLYMTSLFPPRESLVSDIPAGNGNIEKLFLQCVYCIYTVTC